MLRTESLVKTHFTQLRRWRSTNGSIEQHFRTCWFAVNVVLLFAMLGVSGVKSSAATPAASRQGAPRHPAQSPPSPDKPGHVGYLDHLNGFRGTTFGAPLSSFQGLKLTEDLGSLKVYSKDHESEKYLIGNANADRIRYDFIDGRFFAVVIHVSGKDNTESLIQLAEVAFGPGKHIQLSDPHELHPLHDYWTGRIASAHYRQFGDEAELWIGNNQLQDQYVALQKENLAKGASEL